MPIVILKDKDGERVLPIWVGIFEANAIALQIENIATPRPMTHDLLRNIITDLDGRVDRVVVSDLKENTFYAIIHLTVRGERVAVDARPSDAIALALRTRSPILVEETVIDNAKTVDFASERAGQRSAAEVAREPRPRRTWRNTRCEIVGRPTIRDMPDPQPTRISTPTAQSGNARQVDRRPAQLSTNALGRVPFTGHAP